MDLRFYSTVLTTSCHRAIGSILYHSIEMHRDSEVGALMSEVAPKTSFSIVLDSQLVYMRELQTSDVGFIFELDSNPEVVKYVGIQPSTHIDQASQFLQNIQNQYGLFGTGRFAVIEKQSNAFVGWAGIKYDIVGENGHINYYELGYRLLPRFWGKGYATECSNVLVKWAFENFDMDILAANVDTRHEPSRHVLEKVGFVLKGPTFLDNAGLTCYWFELNKEDWRSKSLVTK
jgi:[ribosomal protein S5]-alanine N-acetyltransferase